jgi:hypothetical protein
LGAKAAQVSDEAFGSVWETVDGLRAALAAAEEGDAGRVQELIGALAATLGSTAGPLGGDDVDEILHDLAADLEDYEADEEARGEEPGAFGERDVAARLRTALARLDELGVR